MCKQLSTLSQEQMYIIIALGYRTGSQVLGGATEDSDHDYVMLQSDYDKHFNFPYSQYYGDIFGTSSVKQWFNGNCINILIAETPTQFDAWVYATYTYKTLVSEPINKELRVKLFSALREVYLLCNQ
jgi:hypothetical protein